MGYECTIDAGMLFRKMYCCLCGERLQKEKVIQVYRRGEPGFRTRVATIRTIGMQELTEVSYVYRCPHCGRITTYDEQLRIHKLQKKLKRRILSSDDFNTEAK